jgi:hypothetical protein
MYDYDLATLVVPFLLLLDERRLGTAVPDWVLADLWLAPLLVPLASQMTGWHPGPLLLGAVLAYGLRVAIAEERRS